LELEAIFVGKSRFGINYFCQFVWQNLNGVPKCRFVFLKVASVWCFWLFVILWLFSVVIAGTIAWGIEFSEGMFCYFLVIFFAF